MNENYFVTMYARVFFDNTLSPSIRMLYGHISTLCNKEGFCWATNEYFADAWNKSPETISRMISQLGEKGLISVEIRNGNKRKIYLDKNVKVTLTKTSRVIDENVKGSIYSINNKINTPTSALNFILKNYSIRFEQEFLMEFEKQFNNQQMFDAFLKDFNDEAEMKNQQFGGWLIAMLKKYARNWLQFKKDKSLRVVGNNQNLQSETYLDNAI